MTHRTFLVIGWLLTCGILLGCTVPLGMAYESQRARLRVMETKMAEMRGDLAMAAAACRRAAR